MVQALPIEAFAAHGLRTDHWHDHGRDARSAFSDGAIEIQDEGSQLACTAIANARAVHARSIDLCAGAGGKTLALAAADERTSGTDRRRPIPIVGV